VLSLLRQQTRFHAARDMVLVWGAKQVNDFYALDDVRRLLGEAPHLRVTLGAEAGELPTLAERMSLVRGTVLAALANDRTLMTGRDIYAAGPTVMLRQLALELNRAGVPNDRVHIDSFGV
jgi:ferredoxin-NADP reductase